MSYLKWPSNQTIVFLKVLRKYEALWDASSSDYMKKDRRDNAYSKMMCELNELGFDISVEDARKKIKNLKDSYRSELNKIKKSRSGDGTDGAYKPKLAWFAIADSFLQNVIAGKGSTSSLHLTFEEPDGSGEGEHTSQTQVQNWSQLKMESLSQPQMENLYHSSTEDMPRLKREHFWQQQVESLPQPEIEDISQPEIEDISQPPTEDISQPSQERVSLPPIEDFAETQQESVFQPQMENLARSQRKLQQPARTVTRKQLPEKINLPVRTIFRKSAIDAGHFSQKGDDTLKESQKEDSFDFFGKYIAAELRQLPKRPAILLQQEIQNAITRTKLSRLEHEEQEPFFVSVSSPSHCNVTDSENYSRI